MPLSGREVARKTVAPRGFERAAQQHPILDDRNVDRTIDRAQAVIADLDPDIAAEILLRRLRRDHDVAAVRDAAETHSLRTAQHLHIGEVVELPLRQPRDRHFGELGANRWTDGTEGKALDAKRKSD